jgi:hypothetical protein
LESIGVVVFVLSCCLLVGHGVAKSSVGSRESGADVDVNVDVGSAAGKTEAQRLSGAASFARVSGTSKRGGGYEWGAGKR